MAKQITRKTHKIDATGKVPGRLATEIARILIGKHKPDYMPNMDMGDFVEVENTDKMAVTQKKMDQKEYIHHSGYLGGLKTKKMKNLVAEKGYGHILKNSVSRMLPKNKLRNERMKRLIIK